MSTQVHDERWLVGDVAERVLDQLPVAVCVTDEHGTYRYANRAFEELLGVEAGANVAAGHGHRVRIHRASTTVEYLDEELPTRRALRGDGVVVVDDIELAPSGGLPMVLEVLASPVLDGLGDTTNAVAALFDVSARRLAERDRALLAAVVDSTDDAVVSVDLTGAITSWNKGAEVLYGYSAGEAIGASIAMLVPPSEDGTSALRQIAKLGQVAHHEARRVRKDGSFVTVGETLSPVRAQNGRIVGAASIARDVSARLEAEQNLALTRAELEVRNRHLERSNAELEQFAYVASHDLSEPLRAVAGMVGLLARRYEGRLDSDADEFIAFAVEGCERMRSMIEDLLALSRVGRAEFVMADVDAGEVLGEVLAVLGPQIEQAGATIEIGDLPVVTADRARLGQVFQNLIANAVKFRRAELAVVVGVSATRDGPRTWRFEVTDNGIGIEERYRARIFRMFQRLHTTDVFPGTGIGLAVAERIVERHGGAIGVEASATGGSKFWFTLPEQAVDGGR